MGKFLKRFKEKGQGTTQKLEQIYNKRQDRGPNLNPKRFSQEPRQQITPDIHGGFEEDGFDETNEEFDEGLYDKYGEEVGIQPAQKPESFHHFILENQYKDLERSIRGLKDIWDKQNQKWITKRKKDHCFTDEEAEDILRTAQSHLATDVKLGWIKAEVFGLYMDAVYKEIAFLFESIAEYRYGRYGDFDVQYQMKLQNQKIFLELWTRIQMNYSRAINGQENKATHGSVKGQESLQAVDRDVTGNRGFS